MCSLNLRSEFYKCMGVFYKDWIIARRNFFTIVEVIFWPFIGLASVGFLTSFLNLEREYVSFILIGAISLSVLQVCQIDVAYSLLFEMWSKSIKHVFVAPVRGYHLILGGMLFGILRGTLVFLILVLFSRYLFGFELLEAGLLPVIIFLAGLFLMAGITGMLVCIGILIFGYRAEIAAWTITGIMMFLCGIYYPVSILPGALETLARAIPLTYYLEYLRSFYGFGSGNIAFGLLLGIFYLLLEMQLFELALRRAKSTGMLLKLSE